MSQQPDPTDVVRAGYNDLSYRYRADDDAPEQYVRWVNKLDATLNRSSRVLDLGCGCGVPVARQLADAGHHVTGVDLSDVQIERARTLVPNATFVRADMTTLELPDESFDGIISLYAVIHVPVDAQPALIAKIGRWLAPGGRLLLTAGWGEWTGSETGWLGGDATMWWSHAGVDTYRGWLTDAGLAIDDEQFIPEGDGGHSLFRAHKAA